MAHAYTPGLKVKKFTIVSKTRRLPIQGEVLVKEGDTVKHDQVVARTQVPGEVHLINVANALGVDPEEISQFMLKGLKDPVAKNEVFAKRISFFGLFKSFVKSPVDGTIELVSDVTGQVALREAYIPVEITAYIPGKVVHVMPREGVTIRTPAAFVQGIFGVGGEAHAQLKMIAKSPDDALTAQMIDSSHSGKVIVGGSLVTGDALAKAAKTGVKGIVVGGVEDEDLIKFLGYEIGVAITGQEEIGLTLIITEGFGKMKMPQRTFDLLKSFDGREASVNGATQIRAGVIRPEIVIALTEKEAKGLVEDEEEATGGMTPGTPVRIIRDPYFGAIGQVAGLPVELQKAETESDVRVVQVTLEDGRKVIVPRANVEIIEE
ncbi:hypothetical protein MUP05_09685 [Candidatus Bathyarchaeota archaeon]|nr:hypothetical protein [Candidatus Bathyarchaeota archaeon]